MESSMKLGHAKAPEKSKLWWMATIHIASQTLPPSDETSDNEHLTGWLIMSRGFIATRSWSFQLLSFLLSNAQLTDRPPCPHKAIESSWTKRRSCTRHFRYSIFLSSIELQAVMKANNLNMPFKWVQNGSKLSICSLITQNRSLWLKM